MISVGPEQTPVYTDFIGLDKLKKTARDDPDKALDAVASQFEALFIQTLLKNMRSTSLGDGLFDNDQSRLYQDLFDKQISTNLSQRQGVGLADVLIRQLSSSNNSYEPVLENSADTKRLLPIKTQDQLNTDDQPSFDNHIEYINKIYPIAKEIESVHGIPAKVMVAQSALETGWGKNIIKTNDGRSSYNLFGIKADNRWAGDVVSTVTVEYRNGVAEKSREQFRKYDSFNESMRDYVNFLKTSPRYHEALEMTGAPTFYTNALQRAGYATDPEYADKINNILTSDHFVEAIENLKIGMKAPLT